MRILSGIGTECLIAFVHQVRIKYGYRSYPDFGQVDLCISHLWAGDDAEHPEAYLPYMKQFAKTSASLGANRYFLCHLYEIGRGEDKMWTNAHAAIAKDMIRVEIPGMGQGYTIWTKEI